MSDLSDIYEAIQCLERASARLRNRGDREDARYYEAAVKRASAAYLRISAQWSKAQDALRDQCRSYNAYVTRYRDDDEGQQP